MARMNLTDLQPNDIYHNQAGEVVQLKDMDGKGSVFVKILKELDGKYERIKNGKHRHKVQMSTSAFLVFWRPITSNPWSA